jgi:Diguanylate cyclase, GGDEF domain
MQHGPPRRRRPRPVADAPIGALLTRTEDLTKGWLLALLEAAPLEDASAILAAELTRDGPRICDAAVRALADDDDLRRIEPGGALEQLISRTGELAGATGPEAAARAVDALEAVIWSALRAELAGADADQVSELAERIALVAGLIRGAALRRLGSAAPPRVVGEGSRPRAVGGAARGASPEAIPPEADADAASTEAEAAPPEAGAASPEAAPARAGRPHEALWIGAVEDEIARAQKADSLLSVLLVELEDDRVRATESPPEASATFGRFAQALRSVVRRQDILACETETRAWIIARDTGRAGAQALATRAARAVREARPWRGARMTVNAGIAVFREDGHDPLSLIDSAEQAKFAAAAAGLAVIHELPPEGSGGAGPRLVS